MHGMAGFLQRYKKLFQHNLLRVSIGDITDSFEKKAVAKLQLNGVK
jgi:hypothetical protein